MKKLLLLILLFTSYCASAQYVPSRDGVTVNSPIAPAQQIPVDARSYYHDLTNFLFRPYQSTTEAISWIPQIYRGGNFAVFVCTGTLQSNGTFVGGNLLEYMWRRGTQDSQLVQINIDFPTGIGAGTVTNVSATSGNGINWTITNPTTTPNLALSLAFGGDISGTPNAITVNDFNGLPPAYYLNFNNLTNRPTIPAQFNPIAGTNISLSGTYPNITFNASGGASTAGFGINSGLIAGGVVAIDSLNYRKVDTMSIFDSALTYILNGKPYVLILPSGGGGGSGTVTHVTATNANGVSWTITNPSTTPNLLIALGAITPTSVSGLTLNALSSGWSIQGGTTPYTLTLTGSGTLSGNNSGDVSLTGLTYATLTGQTINLGQVPLGTSVSGNLLAANFGSLTGDVTTSLGSYATTISANAVTYSKFQQMGPATLLGNPTAGTANVQAIGFGYGVHNVGTYNLAIDTSLIGYWSRIYSLFYGALDSLAAITDTNFLVNVGPATALNTGYGNKDTLYFKKLVAGYGINGITNSDSSNELSLNLSVVDSVALSVSPVSARIDTLITVTSNYSAISTYKRASIILNATTGTITLPDPTASANIGRFYFIRTYTSGQTATVATAAGSIETSLGTFSSTATIIGIPFQGWKSNGSNWVLSE